MHCIISDITDFCTQAVEIVRFVCGDSFSEKQPKFVHLRDFVWVRVRAKDVRTFRAANKALMSS